MRYVVIIVIAAIAAALVFSNAEPRQKCIAQELQTNFVPMWTGDVMIMVPSEDWSCTRYAGQP